MARSQTDEVRLAEKAKQLKICGMVSAWIPSRKTLAEALLVWAQSAGIECTFVEARRLMRDFVA